MNHLKPGDLICIIKVTSIWNSKTWSECVVLVPGDILFVISNVDPDSCQPKLLVLINGIRLMETIMDVEDYSWVNQ